MFSILLLTLAADPSPKLPTPKFASGYAAVRARIEKGESLVVYAGVPLPTKAEANAVRVDAIPGEPAGVYDCSRVNGKPTMTARPPAAVVMPVVRTVAGHEHKCRSCGTVWAHADNDPKASHNCPTCGRQELNKHRAVPVEVKPAATKPKRISLNGRWYDQYADGRLVECVT